MLNEVRRLLRDIPITPHFTEVFTLLVLIGAVLIPLERLYPAHPRQRSSLKSKILDLGYWFFTPLCTRFFTNVTLLLIFTALVYLTGWPVNDDLLNGHGPLSWQPLWLQAIELLLIADFVDYWTHRFFHTSRFWKFHAVHHSAEEMDWISSSRMHPVNDLGTRIGQVVPLLLLGFSVHAIMAVVPYLVFYVVFLHSNVRCDFGPFRHILVSPSYHRWHHSSDAKALDKNFSGIFPIWDLLFGTYYFPKTVPEQYGVTKDPPPENLTGQLVYPFRGKAS